MIVLGMLFGNMRKNPEQSWRDYADKWHAKLIENGTNEFKQDGLHIRARTDKDDPRIIYYDATYEGRPWKARTTPPTHEVTVCGTHRFEDTDWHIEWWRADEPRPPRAFEFDFTEGGGTVGLNPAQTFSELPYAITRKDPHAPGLLS